VEQSARKAAGFPCGEFFLIARRGGLFFRQNAPEPVFLETFKKSSLFMKIGAFG
jgi:hypothetical protein